MSKIPAFVISLLVSMGVINPPMTPNQDTVIEASPSPSPSSSPLASPSASPSPTPLASPSASPSASPTPIETPDPEAFDNWGKFVSSLRNKGQRSEAVKEYKENNEKDGGWKIGLVETLRLKFTKEAEEE